MPDRFFWLLGRGLVFAFFGACIALAMMALMLEVSVLFAPHHVFNVRDAITVILLGAAGGASVFAAVYSFSR